MLINSRTPSGQDVLTDFSELELAVCERYRGLIQDLKIEISDGMLVLTGRAYSYYGKQMAQEDVCRHCELGIRANRIEVDG